MSYLVLARKYRPQRFDQVTGQEHITRTLENAVVSGRLAHAILFAGPRGTGKTTVARILAKCVNCENAPTAVPCDACRSCREIAGSHAADVFEIDGASNNKVEDVRELRENAKYLPAHSPFKIYIIDEVHMLSDAAFNALLKILEEPPAHVMFFFATTEPNKIPITILSRCQRHDFRRIPLDAIVEHMAGICRRENVAIDAEGLSLVAREADGSVRDALSLLDHIMACAAGTVDTPDILDILGGIDRRDLFAISDAVFRADAAGVLSIIDRCYARGQHMTKLFSEVVSHFRNLLVVKMGGGPETLADTAAHEIEDLRKQAEGVPLPHIHQVLDALFAEEGALRHSSQPKIALEMAFLRILQIKPVLPLDALIEKLDLLRREAGEQGPVRREAPDGPAGPEPAREALDSAGGAEAADAAEKRPAPAESPAPSSAGESPEAHWHAILERLSQEQPSLAACLAESRLHSMSGERIEIELPPNQFHMNWIKREKNQAILQQVCCDQLGCSAQVCLLNRDAAPDAPGGGGKDKEEAQRLKEEALDHPMVAAAMKLFQGQIIDVKIL